MARTRWRAEQVLALAVDDTSAAAARALAVPTRWSGAGACVEPPVVWGLCASGTRTYRTMVDLTGPAFRCTCPSRKIPCKHALGLLLAWSGGVVPDEPAPDPAAAEWLAARTRAASRKAARSGEPADPVAARRRAERRSERVAAGVAELDRWLLDQVRTGLAGANRGGYAVLDAAAARMVDAQAPALASALRRLPAVLAAGADWPARLLEEYAALRLLIVAYRRRDELPAPLAATVRSRVGHPVGKDEVLATPAVRDRWSVLGSRDSAEDRLTSRRVWLAGTETGRSALVLSFAPSGQPLDGSLLPGTTLDADLHFYPGRPPLRAVVGARHGEAGPYAPPAGHPTVAAALTEWADARAADPWLPSWPLRLGAVLPARHGEGWAVADGTGDALPLAASVGDPWRLIAVSGGAPVALAGEWTPLGLRLISAHGPDGWVAL